MGVDFVGSREYNSLGIRAVDDGAGEGVNEFSNVHVYAGPASSLVECLEVLSVVENAEEGDDFLLLLLVEYTEDVSLRKESLLVKLDEVLDSFNIL